MENHIEVETSMPIEISLPQGVVVPDTGVTARKAEILLTVSQLEQVKTALEHGKQLIQTRLNRTKRTMKRCTTEIEGNVISSVMDKTEHCRPVQPYPVEVLAAELEAMGNCTPYSWFRKFCHNNNIRFCDLHSLRHFYASALINEGVDAAAVSGALGHSVISTTTSIYCHVFQQAQAKAGDAIASVLDFSSKKKKGA